jgi:hypothetical protein
MERYPVAKTCPSCGSAAFKRVRVEKGIAFSDDRKCQECGTRYTPPTPAWAAVLFIASGGFYLRSRVTTSSRSSGLAMVSLTEPVRGIAS